MLATDIIKSLKRQIRIMWIVIIILSLLLFVTNYDDKIIAPMEDTASCEILNKSKDIHFAIPKNEEPQKPIAVRRKRKRLNVE